MADVVLNALCPRVSVYESEDVTSLCRDRLGLPNLATLLKPWQTAGVERVTIRSSNFETVNAPAFPLRFDAASDISEEGPWEREGGWLDSITNQINSRLDVWLGEIADTSAPPATPWYDLFLDDLVDLRPMSPHDASSHPVACLIAVSTAHAEPLNAIAALYAATSPTELFKNRPYADPNVLRYYVVIHDVKNGDMRESQALLEQVKRAYGVHCTVLPINSLDPDAPPPLEEVKDERPAFFDGLWAPFLDQKPRTSMSSDVEPRQEGPAPPVDCVAPGSGLGHKDVLAIRVFLREFVVQSLLPYMERNVQHWNEQLVAARRGLTGRFFSAGRKYFGSRPASPAAGGPPAFLPAKGFYPHQAQEAQARKLADFAFMIRDFRLAASVFEMIRKDNQNDKAWRDYASSSRMLGLSQILLALQAPVRPQKLDTDTFLEQAATASTASAADIDEIRLTCLYAVAYNAWGDHKSAAVALARCASDVEEASSGLLLEQAALALLRSHQPNRRKSALHLCLAALRYETSGVKLLSQRCLQQAITVYGPHAHGWRAICAHVQHSLGRQNYKTGDAGAAALHFLHLLSGSVSDQDEVDEDEVQDQQGFLTDFDQALSLLKVAEPITTNDTDLCFPQTFFRPQETSLRLHSAADPEDHIDQHVWHRLEEESLHAYGDEHSPELALQASSLSNVSLDESFNLLCQVNNPFGASVSLCSLRLDVESIDGPSDGLQVDKVEDVRLAPRESRLLIIGLRGLDECSVRIKGIHYLLDGLLPCYDALLSRGPRLFKTREQRLEPTYATNTCLDVSISSTMPFLALELVEMPESLFASEVVTAKLRIVNRGRVAATDLRIACSMPSFVTVAGAESHNGKVVRISNNLQTPSVTPVSLPRDSLEPGQSQEVSLSVRGDIVGQHSMAFLCTFRRSDGKVSHVYTSRAGWVLDVRQLLDVQHVIRPSMDHEELFSLQLDVRARHNSSAVRIEYIYAISRRWCFTSGDDLVNRPLTLDNDRRDICHIIKANLKPDQGGLEDLDFTSRQLESFLTGRRVRDTTANDIDIFYSCLLDSELPASFAMRLYLASRRRIRLQNLAHQFAALPESIYASVFELFSPRAFDIVIGWTATSLTSSRKHSGFELLADLRLGPAEGTRHMAEVLEKAEERAGGLYAESQLERGLAITAFHRSEYMGTTMPLAISCEGAQAIEVPISTGLLSKKVPMILHVCNVAFARTVDFVLDLVPDTPAVDESRSTTRAAFCGKLVHRGTLEPGQRVHIMCQIWLCDVGVYDTGGWRLQAQDRTASLSWVARGARRLMYVRQHSSAMGREAIGLPQVALVQ